MSERFMPAARAIAQHLSYEHVQDGIQSFSGFAAALRDARRVTGRNPDNGEVIDGQWLDSWIGTIGYMALLDQIGGSFAPKGTSSPRKGVKAALDDFSGLDRPSIDALYALRCAFAHDFSLYNIFNDQLGMNPLTHHFLVYGSTVDSSIVTLPPTPWNGDIYHQTSDTQTRVNLIAFGNLVELIVHKIFDAANANALVVKLRDGSDELLQRYSFFRMPE